MCFQGLLFAFTSNDIGKFQEKCNTQKDYILFYSDKDIALLPKQYKFGCTAMLLWNQTPEKNKRI